MFDWESRIKTLPQQPGVYLMKGEKEEFLYIGKAKNLKKRVRQYFQKTRDERAFVRKLPQLLKSIDIIITNTEKEAILLESTLIRRHQPRFNILLKEEQPYLYLKIDRRAPYPRLEVVRRKAQAAPAKSNEYLFGPYHSGQLLWQTTDIIERYFRLRSCRDSDFNNRVRPCLEYQIKRCDAPCIGAITPEEYAKHVQEVILFLEGKQEELLATLTEKMWQAAERQHYELAARYRDQIQAIRRLNEEEQSITFEDQLDRDIYGFYREGPKIEIQLLIMRKGRLINTRSFSFDQQEFEDTEVLYNFLSAYYLRKHIEPPKEIILPHLPSLSLRENLKELEELLSERRGNRVKLLTPKRGDKAKLVEMARKNAEQSFLEKAKAHKANEKRLEKIQKTLGLAKFPHRIECVDNSHFNGRYPVSSIVVFEGGEPYRAAYRHYHLKDTKPSDDYGAMKEVLTRRFKRGQKEGHLPDLMLIDGGRGQLKIAQIVLEELNIQEIELASIAKPHHLKDNPHDGWHFQHPKEKEEAHDRIFRPNRKGGIPIDQRHAELFLLSKIRDEAHRTAHAFHQKTRDKATLHSILEEIPGVGPQRKKNLLKTLGSLQKVKEASLEQLLEVPSIDTKTARNIYDFFHASPKNKTPST